MKRILLSVLLIVSVVLVGLVFADDPPVMERETPEFGQPETLPNLILDVSCFQSNRVAVGSIRVWNIDANGNELSIFKTINIPHDGRARFLVYKGRNYRIHATAGSFVPKVPSMFNDIKEIYNIQESKAVAFHLTTNWPFDHHPLRR